MPKRGPSRRLASRKRNQKKRLNRIFRMLKFVLMIVRTVVSILSIWTASRVAPGRKPSNKA